MDDRRWTRMDTTARREQERPAGEHAPQRKVTMAEAWESAAEVIAPRRAFTFGVAGLLIFVGVAINFVGSSPKSSAGVPAHTPVPHTHDLRRRISSATAHAQAHGALVPLATTYEIVEDGHVQFVVHKLEEDAVRAKRLPIFSSEHKTADIDPFDDEHRDPLLTIGDMGPNHVLMLNKYPVMADHVLVVTRKYEPQSGVLKGQDLHALYALVKDLPAMGFYNSAEEAGASQTHRHLQAVPLDVWKRFNPNPTARAIPMEAVMRPQAQGVTLSHTPQESEPFSVPRIGFPHRMLWLPRDPGPETLEQAYHRLLNALGRNVKRGMVQRPYNLVMTHDWVMMVPRAQRVYAGVDVSGLGYAGSLLAENDQALAVIKDIGPFRVLQGAATGV